MKNLLLLLACTLGGCIGIDIVDDEVAPRVVITNPIDSLKIGDSYPLTATYFNNVGIEEPTQIQWSSSNEAVISVNSDGVALGVTLGEAQIIAASNVAADTLLIATGENTIIAESIRTAELMTVSSYPLNGTVTLESSSGITTLYFADNFSTTSALPGLYVYLSNNKNTIAGAFEVGAVEKFTGAQEYPLGTSIGLNDYSVVLFFCKPFNVAVGYGELNP